MRRILAAMVTGALLVAAGCSGRYDKRMDLTLEALKYTKRLDDNLQPPASDGPLKELAIYVRPPKTLVEAKEFGLGAVQAGLFDVERTFYEGSKTFLHVLARVKTPKKAAAKGAPPEAAPAARGNFNTDVLGVLKGVFGEDDSLSVEKFKDDPHRSNSYKRAIFATTANGKPAEVQVYLFKNEPYDVALIFVSDPAEKAALASKINLCLESFAVGNKARSKFSGSASEEEAADGASPGVTF